DPANDLSVCYAVRYPNVRNGQNSDRNGGGGASELNIGEHVDPSLFVVEPACGVAGLEVQDRVTRQWIEAEAACKTGEELIVFCGKALEGATDGRIKGTPHRVRRGKSPRTCFIYEQKYADFYCSRLD
ncbi:unnamed protein product, partial [Phaeothamnion confervicola]